MFYRVAFEDMSYPLALIPRPAQEPARRSQSKPPPTKAALASSWLWRCGGWVKRKAPVGTAGCHILVATPIVHGLAGKWLE